MPSIDSWLIKAIVAPLDARLLDQARQNAAIPQHERRIRRLEQADQVLQRYREHGVEPGVSAQDLLKSIPSSSFRPQ